MPVKPQPMSVWHETEWRDRQQRRIATVGARERTNFCVQTSAGLTNVACVRVDGGGGGGGVVVVVIHIILLLLLLMMMMLLLLLVVVVVVLALVVLELVLLLLIVVVIVVVVVVVRVGVIFYFFFVFFFAVFCFFSFFVLIVIPVGLKALESKHVSAQLNRWIDLIFGSKQLGDGAAQAVNLFLPA